MATYCQPDRCPLCGQPDGCPLSSSRAYKGPCWCTGLKISDSLLACVPPEKRNVACICETCIRTFQPETTRRLDPVLQAGDFYFDSDGLIVLTAQCLLRRGCCCGNGCRHCPYGATG